MSLTTDSRQAYIEKVKAQLNQYDAQLAEMKAKADQLAASAQVEYHSLMAEALVKRDAMQAQLTKLQQSSESAWEEIQTGLEKAQSRLEKAGNDLKKSFEAAWEEFK